MNESTSLYELPISCPHNINYRVGRKGQIIHCEYKRSSNILFYKFEAAIKSSCVTVS